MERLVVPVPDEIRRRITECEAELKALRRLYRLSQAAQDVDLAGRSRTLPAEQRGEAARGQ
jgi:hypothetical protein